MTDSVEDSVATSQCAADHSDPRNLGAHPDGHVGWPLLFEDQPRSGLRSDVVCLECGAELVALYRLEEIQTTDGEVVWNREGSA